MADMDRLVLEESESEDVPVVAGMTATVEISA
jgi:hypothetical protein